MVRPTGLEGFRFSMVCPTGLEGFRFSMVCPTGLEAAGLKPSRGAACHPGAGCEFGHGCFSLCAWEGFS